MIPEYDLELKNIVNSAAVELEKYVEKHSPYLGKIFSSWMRKLSENIRAETYFTHPHAFPLLLFPWWMETIYEKNHDIDFQKTLVYSSMSGYYFIRIVDDIMDEVESKYTKFLPLAALLHSQFQYSYSKYFAHDHPFWEIFEKYWILSSESAIKDSALKDISLSDFREVASKKVCAGKIPLYAVALKAGHFGIPEGWGRLFDIFSMWHQMNNDFVDWNRDMLKNRNTYILSEAARRKGSSESIALWMCREGAPHIIKLMQEWMNEMIDISTRLNCPKMEAYLRGRDSMSAFISDDILTGMKQLQKIINLAVDGRFNEYAVL